MPDATASRLPESGNGAPVVLLVDDSEADLLYTRIVLERSGRGWSVTSFESAREALDYLGQAAPPPVNLILLDINMPGMNGFEFLQAYSHLCGTLGAALACAAVVMLTSSPDPDDRSRALAYPCVRDYLLKPIDGGSVDTLTHYLS